MQRCRLARARRLTTLVLVALAATSARADGSDDWSRWAPAMGLFFDILGQKAEGTSSTGPVLGPPLSPFDTEQDAFAPGNGCLRQSLASPGPPPVFVYSRDGTLCATSRQNASTILPTDNGSDTSIVPIVGTTLEVMSPSLVGDHLLRPRVFLHGDVSAGFSYERNLAGVGNPGQFKLPPDLTFTSDPNFVDLEELTIQGQGSRTRMQVDRWLFGGGVGVAFSAELFQRRFRIKPSFEYQREKVEFIGTVHRAVKLRNPSGANNLDQFRFITLTDSTEESYDGIGPGLELEVDASRLGPFISSVFLMARGYYLMGDLDVSMTQTNQFGETATWTAKLDPWAWRTGVGFRIRWSPEE
jgi:hypothetical protein